MSKYGFVSYSSFLVGDTKIVISVMKPINEHLNATDPWLGKKN